MRWFWYTAIIKVVVLIAYSLVLLKVVSLSQEVRIKDVHANTNSSTMDASIDICYPLRLSSEYCHLLDDPDKETLKVEPDACKDHMPIGCCTKGLKKPSEIIGAFRENVADLVHISSESGEDPSQKSVHIQFDQICVKYQFENLKHSADNARSTMFEIQSSESNYQTFDIHFSFIRKYPDGAEYVADRKYLIKRNCWTAGKDKPGCLETDKQVTVRVEYFSSRYKKKPFVTRCKENNETPSECYDKCAKKEKPNFLMSYNESDQMELDFNAYDHRRCWRACTRPNCLTGAFYIRGIDERGIDSKTAAKIAKPEENGVRKFPGIIRLKATSAPFGVDAVPLLSRSRFIWMISLSVAVFMGLDCYGIFVRTTKIYSKSGNQKKNPKRSQIKVAFAVFIFSASLTLACFCEKILFNFGADLNPHNETRLIEIQSVTERDVSISVCFDLCGIWNTDQDKKQLCNETLLREMTLKELESKTRDANWFRSIASLKNNVKYVPIRQREKIIPSFYRNMKKCYLVSHEASSVLPHMSLQRKSFIHLTLQRGKGKITPDYAHFYVVDGSGLAFPDIAANPGKRSAMHYVEIHYENGACNYTSSNETNSLFVTREDHVQRCIVEKFSAAHKRLPTFVNFKIAKDVGEEMDENYLEMPFEPVSREAEMGWIEKCEKEVSERRCTKTITTLSNFELLEEQLGEVAKEDEGGQYIVVNLTPILLEKQPFERESLLIIFNRLMSFVMLFTCYSVAEAMKNLIGTYFYSFRSIYNFSFIKKISHILVFFTYLLHLAILAHGITNSVTRVYETEFVKSFEFPLIRLCYEHGYRIGQETLATFVDWEEVNGPKMKTVNEKSLKFDELVDEIRLYDEFQNYKLLNSTKLGQRSDFFVDALKCFNFKIYKSYDARNPMVQKAEKFLEIHINLTNIDTSIKTHYKEIPKKNNRIYLFLDDKKTLNLDQDKPFNSDATIHFVKRAFTYEEDYWIWNNWITYIKNLIVGPESYGIFEYLERLSRAFGDEQSTSTTTVPLDVYKIEKNDSRATMPLRNRKFSAFIHFRDIDAPYKNKYTLAKRVELESYYLVSYMENRAKKGQRPEKLRLSLKPNLVQVTTRQVDNYTSMELFFHMAALTKLYFKFNFFEIPELAERAWPSIKFFAFLTLYLIVVGLLRLFDWWFKMAKVIELRYADKLNKIRGK